jgi:hypothetical protein
MAIGALLPWRIIGSLLFVSLNGVATWWGWLVLALGLATIATAGILLLAHRRPLRIAATAGSLVFAALVIAVSVQQVHHIRGQTTAAIRQGIAQSTGRPATSQEMATTQQLVHALGLSLEPWAGLYVCAAGGGLAIAGAFGTAAFGARRLSRSS